MRLHNPSGKSKAELIANLPKKEQKKLLDSLSKQEKEFLLYDWNFWARPNQLMPAGDWFIWLLLAGRGFGKALDINTPILTTNGWKTMGTLNIGDYVFAPDGNTTMVNFATEIMHDHKCYDVVFNDGSKITADAEHLWFTWDKSARKAVRRAKNPISQPKIVTTEQIKETLKVGKETNHSILNTEAIDFPKAELEIDPYILGLWLGDGSSAGASITCDDIETIQEIERIGHKCSKWVVPFMYGIKDLHSKLRALNLLKNKHIPEKYLYSSKEQRLALLQGLMDTDGTISDTGHSCFDNTNRGLAEGVRWLAISLGIKTSQINTKETRCNGKICEPCFRVWFTTDVPIFRLPRKLNRIRKENSHYRNNHRFIVDVIERKSVPVRCIQVEHESHLYLAGKELIPTHNTRSGAEVVRWAVNHGYRRIALAAPTAADCRDVLIEGESGILNVFPNDERPIYEPSKRRVTFANGAIATLFSAEEPSRFRGPQFDFAWLDEVATWPNLDKAIQALLPAIRLGVDPRLIITTTPQPLPLLKEWVEDSEVIVTKGSTFDNKFNLAKRTLKYLDKTFSGTTIGRQELEGELLGGVPGALWVSEIIDDNRVKEYPDLKRIVVSIDPSANQGSKDACECGIVVAGIGYNEHVYVLEDLSGAFSPLQWVKEAYIGYEKHKADRIIFEGNLAGAFVTTTFDLLFPNAPLKAVYATKNKTTRAEPISALYEKGMVHHVGLHKELEDQLTTWTPGKKSPDRLDALVWAVTELALGSEPIGSSAFSDYNPNDFKRSFYDDRNTDDYDN